MFYLLNGDYNLNRIHELRPQLAQPGAQISPGCFRSPHRLFWCLAACLGGLVSPVSLCSTLSSGSWGCLRHVQESWLQHSPAPVHCPHPRPALSCHNLHGSLGEERRVYLEGEGDLVSRSITPKAM